MIIKACLQRRYGCRKNFILLRYRVYDNIDNAQFDTCKDTLLEVVNELIDIKHIADSFKLLEFYTNNDY